MGHWQRFRIYPEFPNDPETLNRKFGFWTMIWWRGQHLSWAAPSWEAPNKPIDLKLLIFAWRANPRLTGQKTNAFPYLELDNWLMRSISLRKRLTIPRTFVRWWEQHLSHIWSIDIQRKHLSVGWINAREEQYYGLMRSILKESPTMVRWREQHLGHICIPWNNTNFIYTKYFFHTPKGGREITMFNPETNPSSSMKFNSVQTPHANESRPASAKQPFFFYILACRCDGWHWWIGHEKDETLINN